MAQLDVCEEIVILRMYNMRIIGMNYRPLKMVAADIQWMKLVEKYNCSKDFEKIIRRLFQYRLASDHGKRGEVAALTPAGKDYAVALIKLRKYPDELPETGKMF
ncbi:MAG: hypothetical protein ACRECH_09455 [Nitrososphaerales archaeon]